MPRYEVDWDRCSRVHMKNVVGWSTVPVRVFPLMVACAACATELRHDAKFCDECGAGVGPARSFAEYKQVTVLFADVVHSMDIAAAVGPGAPPWTSAATWRTLRNRGGDVHRMDDVGEQHGDLLVLGKAARPTPAPHSSQNFASWRSSVAHAAQATISGTRARNIRPADHVSSCARVCNGPVDFIPRHEGPRLLQRDGASMRASAAPRQLWMPIAESQVLRFRSVTVDLDVSAAVHAWGRGWPRPASETLGLPAGSSCRAG